MRSRSSRLFFVLLHLVGCPQHFTNTFEGIVGVQPWPMVLETLSAEDSLQQPEPVWLQDASSQACLGLDGKFTRDCGDATLWLPVRQPLRKRKRARMGLWGVDEEAVDEEEARSQTEGLVFYLVDRDVQEILDATIHCHKRTWWNPLSWNRPAKKHQQSLPPLECLTHDTADGSMSVQACDTSPHKIPRSAALPSWGWSIEEGDSSLRPTIRHNHQQGEICTFVSQSNQAHLSACGSGSGLGNADDLSRQAELSLVRYRAAPATAVAAKEAAAPEKEAKTNFVITRVKEGESRETSRETVAGEAKVQPPQPLSSLSTKSRDLAHKAALDPAMHPGLSSSPRLLFEKRAAFGGPPASATKAEAAPAINGRGVAGLMHNTNPILMAGQFGSRPPEAKKPASSLLAHPEGKHDGSGIGSPVMVEGIHRPRRIPTHPYIAACKDEVWTDPQTGLTYPTDLSTYLGHDRRERGRHTLMGVGQYRKARVIKIYGIAFYASKRDVLADAFFEPYADLSAEELQQYPEFYRHLRSLHPHHNFERSIMIKTNMQLAAETIRGSLKADWTLLTEEAKELIAVSSMKEQPMDDRTEAILKDTQNNPSKCSCLSIAPPEYDADPSCCARGTELVFTWLQNGDMECRLNGRMVHVFPRPDIAEGIFYEYLRTDDPISPELIDRVVDGFPFLLAPLAQVKGVHVGAPPPAQKMSTTKQENPFVKAMAGFAESVGSHAAGMAGAAQRAAADTSSSVQHAAKAFADSARAMGDSARSVSNDIGKEMTRRRELLAKRASALPEALVKWRKDPVQTMKDLLSRSPNVRSLPSTEQGQELELEHPGLAAEPIPTWFGNVHYAPDEIGPMIIRPTMNFTKKLFIFMVHLYLMLLFIVSIPGSYTVFVLRRERKLQRRLSSGSDWSEGEESDFSSAPSSTRRVSFERRQVQEKLFNHRYVGGVRLALSHKTSGEDEDEGTTSDDNSSRLLTPPLKQKSLSYFL